ncbi:FecR protein [Roseibium album]|nr:FecR protein [Roseibium album]
MRSGRFFLAIALTFACSTSVLADKVGITIDADDTVRATGGSAARIVVTKTSIFRNDRLRANASGNAQIRLIDGTKIVVGPNADVKIDDFVISGQTVTKLTVSATRGAFRFISGRSKSAAYKIRTPNGTIGVRGTAFDVTITRQGTNIALLRGAIRACDRGGRCQVIRNRCDYALIGRRGVRKDRLNSDALRARSKSLFPLLVNETKLRNQFRQRAAGCTVKNAKAPSDRDQPVNIFRALFNPQRAPTQANPVSNSPDPVTSPSDPPSNPGDPPSPPSDPPSPPSEPPSPPSEPPSTAGLPNNPGNGKAVGNSGERFSNGSRGNSANAPGQNDGSRGKSASAPGKNK